MRCEFGGDGTLLFSGPLIILNLTLEAQKEIKICFFAKYCTEENILYSSNILCKQLINQGEKGKNVNSNLAANGAFDLQLPDEFSNDMNNLF